MQSRILTGRASRALVVILLALLAHPADAQRMSQYARASVESAQMMARGGAGVALPSTESALFYNPAHLARLGLQRPRVEVLSVQGAASANLAGNLRFLLGDVRDAIEDGIDVPLTPSNRALFDEALVRGSRATVGQAAVALPVVLMPVGGGTLGFGFFGTNTTRYRFEDIGGGVPLLDFFSQADVIAVASGAGVVPNTPLAIGATTRLARRYIGSKLKDLLSMDPSHEQIYVIAGTTVALDLGLHATDLAPQLPGRLDLGLSVYDLLGGGFDYGLTSTIAFTGEGADDARELDNILRAFGDRDGSPSVRAGAAYHLSDVGPLSNAALALDWVSTSTSESRQPVLAGFRFGAEAEMLGRLSIRAGVGQGYPAGGFGVRLPGFRVDYSLFGVEDGRLPGQMGRYTHLLQVKLGVF